MSILGTRLILFGHHKCATTWMTGIIQRVCLYSGWRFAVLSHAGEFQADLPAFFQKNQLDFAAYTNADIQFVASLDHYRGFHMVRDPRDIIVSAYFSHLYSHPTTHWADLEIQREKLKNVSKDEGVTLTIDYLAHVFEQIGSWDYNLPEVLEVRYEDVIISPYQKVLEIFRFLGVLDETGFSLQQQSLHLIRYLLNALYWRYKWAAPMRFPIKKIKAETLLGIVHGMRFSSLSNGRQMGEEDIKSHYRKGVPGDWRNHFTPDHKQYFKERYGNLLIKLGYETDQNW